MLANEPNKIRRRIASQRRFGKVRIARYEGLGLTMHVGEIAAAAAGNQDFFPIEFECSKTATRRPRLPASTAHIRPAAPPPTMITSKDWLKVRISRQRALTRNNFRGSNGLSHMPHRVIGGVHQ